VCTGPIFKYLDLKYVLSLSSILSNLLFSLQPATTTTKAMGVRDLDMHILTLSYPWLGLPVELLRRQRKPTGGLICAHVVRAEVAVSIIAKKMPKKLSTFKIKPSTHHHDHRPTTMNSSHAPPPLTFFLVLP
jgi:hypothetical protein